MFGKSVFGKNLFEVFGPIRGVGGDGFSMVFSGFGGWVSDRTNGGGSVGQSVSQPASQLVRLVRCPLGQAPVRQSASQPVSQPVSQPEIAIWRQSGGRQSGGRQSGGQQSGDNLADDNDMFLFGNDMFLFENDMFLFENDMFLFGNDMKCGVILHLVCGSLV